MVGLPIKCTEWPARIYPRLNYLDRPLNASGVDGMNAWAYQMSVNLKSAILACGHNFTIDPYNFVWFETGHNYLGRRSS
jgi:hypothetical protein